MPDDAKAILFRNARREGEFGPPLFDETKNSHRWRHFKKLGHLGVISKPNDNLVIEGGHRIKF